MRRLAPLALLLLACEPPMPPAARVPIVDGTFEPGEDAVVLVTAFGAAGLCTGTLIAPNVVLTAKHCVQAPGMSAPYPATAMTVGVGSRDGETRDYRVLSIDTTPGVYEQSDTIGLTGEIFGIDVALMILRGPVEGVTPIPIRRERPDDMIGQPFTAIGFGRRPDGGAGTKYKTEGIVQALTETGIIYTENVICSGDSGGPMIQETPDRRVIGVASFGRAGQCPSSQDGYNALWNNLDYVDRALVLGGNCLGGDELCNSLDDDCDGTIDEGCVAIGASCTESSQCANAQLPAFLDPLAAPVECADVGGGSICTRRCDPSRPQASCSSLEGLGGASVPLDGHYCRRDGCEGFCLPGGPGPAADGIACGTDTECGSLFCADPGDGAQRCLLPCRPAAGECPLGEICVGSAEGCGGCVDASLVSGGRSLGEPCATDAECGERCLDGACSVGCSAVMPCPEGFRCGGALFCERGAPGGSGDPCTEDADCRGESVCASEGDRSWCAGQCEGEGSCPAGMQCVDRPEGRVCAPEGAILGESCGGDVCADGVCEDGRCTRACGAGTHCPAGFSCRRDGSGRARCLVPDSGGGCSASARPPGPSAVLFLFLGLCLVYARRRA